MFLRLLWESFVRQRRRKLLAGVAILLGTTAVTAMLALATTIGDRIHRELAVYGANIVVFPKADQLAVKIGEVDVKPATGGTYLKESNLEKLKTIFWANNITGVSPELSHAAQIANNPQGTPLQATVIGMWFSHPFGDLKTGAPALHPWWKLTGSWPHVASSHARNDVPEAVVGAALARRLHLLSGGILYYAEGPHASLQPMHITGVVTTGDKTDDQVLVLLSTQQSLTSLPEGFPDAIDRVDISARTKPEDAFARRDPDTMSGPTREIWYCRPYANSIAYQIREAIPGAQAEQVRRVEQTEGTVLERISGLMWLVSGAALLAAGFAVSAAMATAVLERRREIGLMRSLGASKSAIAMLFYAESGLLAIAAGTVGYLAGSLLAFWLGARIFPGDGTAPLLNLVLLPMVVALALIVAVGGSTPSIRKALEMDPSAVLRVDA